MNRNRGSATQSILGAIVGIGIIVYFFGGGLEKQAAKEMEKIEDQVATDSVKQYEIVKRNGTPIDACVHAGMVSAAYVQAKDEPNYQRWKAVEKADCELAGISK